MLLEHYLLRYFVLAKGQVGNIQIQPGLKAKLWLIIRVNKKKLNRVMLNGDDNENGFKTNRSIQQQNKLCVQHTFSSNQQKTNLHMQHAFLSFPCRCFALLQRCFVRLKRQTSQLHNIFYFYLTGTRGIIVNYSKRLSDTINIMI